MVIFKITCTLVVYHTYNFSIFSYCLYTGRGWSSFQPYNAFRDLGRGLRWLHIPCFLPGICFISTTNFETSFLSISVCFYELLRKMHRRLQQVNKNGYYFEVTFAWKAPSKRKYKSQCLCKAKQVEKLSFLLLNYFLWFRRQKLSGPNPAGSTS